jgi:hypothetical protein
VGAIEQLSTFKDHLDYVLVAVVLGSGAGIKRKSEDIHGNDRINKPAQPKSILHQHR